MFLLLPALAFAADLTLTFDPTGDSPETVTLHDVGPGVLPGVVLAGDDGVRHLLGVEVVAVEGERWTLAFTFDDEALDRRGRTRTERLAAPTMPALLGEPGSFSVTREVPVERDGGARFDARTISVEWALSEG